MFIHKRVRSSRIFTNRLLRELRNCQTNFITINAEVSRNIRWFLHFIPQFNGTATYVHNDPPNAHTLAIDASLHRLGGIWDNKIYTVAIPDNVRNNKNIVHFEMVNIMIALKIWNKHWQGKHIKFLVDNEAVVTVCNTGFTRDPWLATYIRNVWLICSTHDIHITVSHIYGRKNTMADLLSRWEGTQANHRLLREHVKNPEWEDVSIEAFEVNLEI